ncbi:MAG: HEAT repeat domain-containing protein [Dehalococcoidia bacterium]|nr:HEAT repeat domain-containing protein [Dehalococcoidia bacterium]
MPERRAHLELPTGELVALEGTQVIGRSSEADITIADPEASRRHAEFRQEGGLFLLADLGSSNGTRVNDQPLHDVHRLQDGDRLLIGQTAAVFRLEDPQVAPTQVLSALPEVDPTVRVAVPSTSPLQVLGRISRLMAGVADARELAVAVTSSLRDDYGCEAAALLLKEPDGDGYYFAAAAANAGSDIRALPLRKGEGAVGKAIESNEAILVASPVDGEASTDAVASALGLEDVAVLAVPVPGVDGTVIGGLQVINPVAKPAFDGEDVELLALVAGQLGVALQNARSWDSLEAERASGARIAAIRREFVAASPDMVRAIADVAALHAARVPVYLAGEAGTGKSALARLTHVAAPGSGSFVTVDASTGIEEISAAFIEASPPDTICIEEALGQPADIQEQLGRLIASLPAGTRPAIIATGEATIEVALGEGRLAPSLHAALEAGQVLLPSLRERPDDLEPLIAMFTEASSVALGRTAFALSDDANGLLRDYGWPGNVAELESAIRRVAVLRREAVVSAEDLLAFLPELHPKAPAPGELPVGAIRRRLIARRSAALEQLKSPEPGRRADAMASLSAEKDGAVTRAIEALLDDPVSWVRVAAAEDLAARPDTSGALAARLESEVDPTVVVRLLGALTAHGDAAQYDVVRRGLRAPDPRVRRHAMRALRLTGSPSDAGLALQLAADTDPSVRAEASAALVAWGQDDGAAFEAILRDGSPDECATACTIAGESGLAADALLDAVRTGELAVRVAAIRALGRSTDPRAPEALQPLLNDHTLRAEVATALGALRSASAAPALERIALQADVPDGVRLAAIGALGSIGTAEAAASLAQLFGQRTNTVAVLTALAETDDGSAEQPVINALPALTPEEFAAALKYLARAGSSSAVRPLLEAASSPALEEQVYVCLMAIARRNPGSTLAELEVSVAEDGSHSLALELMGELGDPSVVPILLRHQASPEAAIALARLGTNVVPAALEALDGPERESAAEALVAMGAAAVDELISRLDAEPLRSSARDVLATIGEPALPAVLAALEQPEGPATSALLEVVGRVGNSRLAGYISRFAESPAPDVRFAALIALGNLADPRSEEVLTAALESSDRRARLVALLSLGRLQSTAAFEMFVSRANSGDRLEQYAVAGALASYNLQQPPVLAVIPELLRRGLPSTLPALAAVLGSDALSPAGVVDILRDEQIPLPQRAWLITAIGRLPELDAVPVLAHVVRQQLPLPLATVANAAYARLCGAALEDAADLLRNEETRATGIAVLEAVEDASTMFGILKAVAPLHRTDHDLRNALGTIRETLLASLLEVVYTDWDMESLQVLFEIGEIAESGHADGGGTS